MRNKFRLIIDRLLNNVYEEIGDQDGFYDNMLFDALDSIDRGEATFASLRSALSLFRDKVNNKDNAYPHPYGPLKVRHLVNINHWIGEAFQSLRKLETPDYTPHLDRPAVEVTTDK